MDITYVVSGVTIPDTVGRPVQPTTLVLLESPPELSDPIFDSSDDSELLPLSEPPAKGDIIIDEELSDVEDFGYPSDMKEEFPSEVPHYMNIQPTLNLTLDPSPMLVEE
ncbi:hypothetical protein KSP40_PGU001542 [Platanthera guangdongensis]|uniref:Uncharacterized protein n=1 Tax=Platanthera guangdongensis TaxID=2320717 RepID=A0ABR2N0F1_9ASPA